LTNKQKFKLNNLAFCSDGKIAEEARSAGGWYWGFRPDEGAA
jgi:hypothetical protein